jgi:hypothetical protein
LKDEIVKEIKLEKNLKKWKQLVLIFETLDTIMSRGTNVVESKP